MRTGFVAVVSIFLSATVCAAERAVEAVHYEIGAKGQYVDYSFESLGSEVDGFDLSGSLGGQLTVPVGPYLGAFFGAEFEKSANEQYDGDLEYDDETLRGRVGLFYRHPSIGRVTLGYGRERTESTTTFYGGSIYDDTVTITYNSYLASVEAYAGPVTIRLADTRYYFDDDEDEHWDAAFASVAWYVTSNVRLSAQAGFADAKDSYLADVEFQPSFMGNVCGFSLGYFRSTESEDDTVANGVRLGVTVYFDKRFDLQSRDRRYR